jgi:transcriptional regulator with XRE-family HTH domain
MVSRATKPLARQLFADNVRRLRELRGWSQETLATQAKLHRTYVGSVERAERNVSIDNMEKIARALSVALHVLLREATP